MNQLTQPTQSLHPIGKAANIGSLTKNAYTQCHAYNLAFFVPKIWQKSPGLVVSAVHLGIKNRIHISQYGRVNGRIKDLLRGKKSSRVSAISDTRLPESKTGRNTKNAYGGHTYA